MERKHNWDKNYHNRFLLLETVRKTGRLDNIPDDGGIAHQRVLNAIKDGVIEKKNDWEYVLTPEGCGYLYTLHQIWNGEVSSLPKIDRRHLGPRFGDEVSQVR